MKVTLATLDASNRKPAERDSNRTATGQSTTSDRARTTASGEREGLEVYHPSVDGDVLRPIAPRHMAKKAFAGGCIAALGDR